MSGAQLGEVPPSQTLYVSNLREKVKKEELKKALYQIFSQFGPILDVVALKTAKMRGFSFLFFSFLFFLFFFFPFCFFFFLSVSFFSF